MIRHRKEPGVFTTAQRVFTQTIGADLVSVQPMGAPKGKLVYLDFQTPHTKKKHENKTQKMQHTKTDEHSEPKYRVGDKFRENYVRGNVWWEIVEVRYGVTEPEYDLTNKPLNTQTITLGESALDTKYHKLNTQFTK